MHRSLNLLLLPVAILIAFTAWASTPQRAKSRYYYLEGAKRQAEGKIPEAYEFFKKARMADPSNPDASYAYGNMRLMLRTDSMQSFPELRRSLNMMQPYVDKWPEDFVESRTYAYVASHLDTLPEAIRVYERMLDIKPDDQMNLLLLSDAYMASHRPDDALAMLNRFQTIEGRSTQLSMKKTGILLAKGDTVGAIAEIDALIDSNPSDPTNYILKGNFYDVIGRKDSVISAYKEAERVSPGNGQAKLALAQAYKNSGDSVGFDTKVYEALLSEDFELEDKLGLLSEYLQTLLDDSSDTSRGDHLFDVLNQQFPHQPEVLDLAARYSAAKRNWEDAEEKMGYAIDLDSSNPNYWTHLIRFQLAAGKPAEAMASFKKASQLVAPTETMEMMYAEAAAQTGNWREAEKTYQAMLDVFIPGLSTTDSITDTSTRNSLDYDDLRQTSSIFTMLGDMYQKKGVTDSAFLAYSNALFFFPSNAMALNNYAYFLAESDKELDKALEMSTRAIELEPDNDTYLDTHAWVLFKRKDYTQALEYQEKAMAKAKENGETESSELLSHLGDILFMNHRPFEAVANWKKALELEPDNELLKKKVKHKTFFFD